MCGISGYHLLNKSISSRNILEMNDAIRHRGPDDEGFWLSDGTSCKSFSGQSSTSAVKNSFPILSATDSRIALGFRRLTIVDLSEKGHQPMLSDDDSITITFNGEIYNFKTLKKELEQLGHHFRSHSDTEVILRGYQEWGTAIFAKLDGMFALALVDLNLRQLILARDRMGMKPLFYYHQNDAIVWASEIKALLMNELIQPKIHWQGVYSNFLFQTTLAPETCFQDIFSLDTGTFMSINLDNGMAEKVRFWDLPKATSNVVDESQAVAEIDRLLSESVEKQLYADVPVTSMMSGGIDSTLITAQSKKYKEDINAFTIAYPFSESEIKNAQLMAEQIDIPHHIKTVSDDEILQQLKDNIQHFEEPYSSLEVLMNAAEYARTLGFKVVLSGNGADELFAGYSHSLKLGRWKKTRPFSFLRHFLITNDDLSKKIKNYLSQEDMLDFFRQSQVAMKPAEVKEVLNGEIYKSISPQLNDKKTSKTKDYEGLFEYDMRYSLSSHHVFRDDLSAMKYGVEFRYPYLSNELIDYVASLPANLRFNGIQNKPLLRKVAQSYVHPEVLKMPKRGFSFPLAHFIRTEARVRNFVTEQLESLKTRGFFNAATIDQWWQNQNSDYDCVKIWQLVTFELWYQRYFES